MKKLFLFLCFIYLFLSCAAFAAKPVIVLDVNGAIGPATQDYIERGLAFAENQKAELVVIQLDTPGGLEISMRGINKAILGSSIPVVTFVSPEGARAASAGTYILYASHFAAMNEGTHLGAASPVNLNAPVNSEQKNQTTLQKKMMQDSIAYIKSLAMLRHRNAAWGELAVKQAASLSADEAFKQHVIDMTATSIPNLLQKINGHVYEIQHVKHPLNTRDVEIKNYHPDWRYKFLSIITEPNLAYILFFIGIYGLFFELSAPGMVIPGVVGVISLLLALYAFALLPINYVGLSLLLVGAACFVGEIVISSFGVLGVFGVLAFIAGSILLLDVDVTGVRIPWKLIITMCVITALFFFMVITLAVRSQRKSIVTGREELIGMEAEVLEYGPDRCIVRVHGEIWQATTKTLLKPGEKVRVTQVNNLMLTVEPKVLPPRNN